MKAIIGLLLLALAAGDALACSYRYPSVTAAPPLYRRAPDGRELGLIPELAARVQQLSGCQLFSVELPLARRNVEFTQGKLPMILLVIYSPEIVKVAEFVPLARLRLRATVRSNSPQHTADALLADPNTRLGMLRGALFPAEVQQRLAALQASGRVEYSNDRDSLYQKLRRGRLDGILETTSWLNLPKDELGLRYLHFSPPLYLTVGSYLSNRLPQNERSTLRQALQHIGSSGEFTQMVYKHLPLLKGQVQAPVAATQRKP
ncbi:hypothetical protein [Vogesella oryzae]|uniref:hypothetical protein n=1 Tax=Vogesella oryzae TaxID=1735285 RepID=UPI0015822D6D|nr:hypothetical protein [Vogesella oryzae]